MTTATFWLLTVVAVMADGRHLVTHHTYAEKDNCTAAGLIYTEQLHTGRVPAGWTCTEIKNATQ